MYLIGIYLSKIMFTGGRIVFVIVFVVVFVAGLIWAYRKERIVTQIHFKKSYLILIGIMAFLTLMYLIVKMRKIL